MSVTSQAVLDSTSRTAAPADGPATGEDAQRELLSDLARLIAQGRPTVGEALALCASRLSGAAELRGATVFEIDADTGTLQVAAQYGESDPRDLTCARRALHLPADDRPGSDDDCLAVPLTMCGHAVGALLLAGSNLAAVRTDALAVAALLLATAHKLEAEDEQRMARHTSAAVRVLFEKGLPSTNIQDAAAVVLSSTAEGFGTQRVGLFLVDENERVRLVDSRGLSAEDGRALAAAVLGKVATDFAVWREVRSSRKPLLVNDTHTASFSSGCLVQAMGLRSYVAMPLALNGRWVGMLVCGDVGVTREWTSLDRVLAEKFGTLAALVVDNAELRQAHLAQLTHRALHDPLTGLHNREGFREQAEEMASGCGRAALLLLDLNGFKQVNDTRGHQVGDVLLQRVAKRLVASVREKDVVARLGGDEFAVLLSGDLEMACIEQVAARICERLGEPFMIEGEQVTIGASIGIALIPQDTTDWLDLVRLADAAMYEAKRETKHLGGGYRRA